MSQAAGKAAGTLSLMKKEMPPPYTSIDITTDTTILIHRLDIKKWISIN